ncbi:MAG TPA: metal-dependent transcriptional regulator [Roseiflexaceae bacterium]|nr:metal-dependent transcriptional regulator [Roseiflexaceae bacterium]
MKTKSRLHHAAHTLESPLPRSDGQTPALTPAVEDYLKAIYTLQHSGKRASTTALCVQLGGLKPGSVSGMLRRLEELGLITHQLYQEARLTPIGERAALALVRSHRLLETFLVAVLGYSWDEVHAEAEALEHHISPKLAARIAACLGDPMVDPHGDPIPRCDGSLPDADSQRLSDLTLGDHAEIIRVTAQGDNQLRYLATLGLVLGARVQIIRRAPFDGPLQLAVGSTTHILDSQLARQIFVRR